MDAAKKFQLCQTSEYGTRYFNRNASLKVYESYKLKKGETYEIKPTGFADQQHRLTTIGFYEGYFDIVLPMSNPKTNYRAFIKSREDGYFLYEECNVGYSMICRDASIDLVENLILNIGKVCDIVILHV